MGAVVVLLYHRGVLMCQCLPPGRYTRVYWRRTPWHTEGHLPEETSWGRSRNSDTCERNERASVTEAEGGTKWKVQQMKGCRAKWLWLCGELCWPWLNSEVWVDEAYLSSRCWSSVRCSFSRLISSLLILVISLFLSMYLTTSITSEASGWYMYAGVDRNKEILKKTLPVHVEHRGKLELVVDLLGTS